MTDQPRPAPPLGIAIDRLTRVVAKGGIATQPELRGAASEVLDAWHARGYTLVPRDEAIAVSLGDPIPWADHDPGLGADGPSVQSALGRYARAIDAVIYERPVMALVVETTGGTRHLLPPTRWEHLGPDLPASLDFGSGSWAAASARAIVRPALATLAT